MLCACPHCQQPMQSRGGTGGSIVLCPRCRNKVSIPPVPLPEVVSVPGESWTRRQSLLVCCGIVAVVFVGAILGVLMSLGGQNDIAEPEPQLQAPPVQPPSPPPNFACFCGHAFRVPWHQTVQKGHSVVRCPACGRAQGGHLIRDGNDRPFRRLDDWIYIDTTEPIDLNRPPEP